MVVLFTLVTLSEDDDLRGTDDLVQRDISCAAERDDQFALRRVLGSFAEAERGDGKAVLRGRPDCFDHCLGTIKVLGRLGQVEQEVEEASQVSFGARSQLDDEIHRPSFLRLVSSFDCSFANTVSTGTETPGWWYASDAA